MAVHNFTFEGGEILTGMGASWFVSYAYYEKIDRNHKNWAKVSTTQPRLSKYNKGTGELVRDMYISACSLIGGGITQAFIEIPVLGYMIGSFVGSLVGSFTYNVGYKAVLSFCVDSGFTMFGLVEQDYVLPKELIKEIGIETFDYETFETTTFEPKSFAVSSFELDTFEPDTLDIHFLRRGVIGVSRIGYI